MMLAKRRIKKAPVPRKPSPCPVCGDRRGFCISGSVKFVPEQWWGRKKARRTK